MSVAESEIITRLFGCACVDLTGRCVCLRQDQLRYIEYLLGLLGQMGVRPLDLDVWLQRNIIEEF